MVRKPIEDWLNSVYGLPVVDEFEGTIEKNEQSISYDLTAEPINVRYTDNGMVRYEFGFNILYRVANGFNGIGFLSLQLADRERKTPGFGILSSDGTETITFQNKTEMIIVKSLRAFYEIDYNKVREIIKQINFKE